MKREGMNDAVVAMTCPCYSDPAGGGPAEPLATSKPNHPQTHPQRLTSRPGSALPATGMAWQPSWDAQQTHSACAAGLRSGIAHGTPVTSGSRHTSRDQAVVHRAGGGTEGPSGPHPPKPCWTAAPAPVIPVPTAMPPIDARTESTSGADGQSLQRHGGSGTSRGAWQQRAPLESVDGPKQYHGTRG